MDQIIKNLASRLNLPEETVRSAVGVILNILKKKSTGTQFEKLLGAIPGSATVMFSAGSSSGSGGFLGGLLKKAGAGDLGEALAGLQGAGVPMDKAVPLAKGLFAEIRDTAGPDVVSALVEQVPALKNLLATEDREGPEAG